MRKFLALLLSICCVVLIFTGCNTQSNSTPNSEEKDIKPVVEDEVIIDPLTGFEDKDYQQGVRPVAFMINNIEQALPQSGIQDASLFYEMVTEGGIARIMAVYGDLDDVDRIGPIRSGRDQHIQLAFPLQAMYVDIGASTFANAMLAQYNYEDKTIDGNLGSVRDLAFELDEERHKTKAIEHCYYTTGDLIKTAIDTYSKESTTDEVIAPVFDFVPFDDEPRVLSGGQVDEVYVDFSYYMGSKFVYNKDTNKYEKWEFDREQIDELTGKVLSVDNVFILFTEITPRPDGVLMNVNYDWGGVGYYYNGGNYEEVRWLKGTPEMPLRIVDADGNEIDVKVNPGKSYISVVSDDNIGTLSHDGELVFPLAKEQAQAAIKEEAERPLKK